MDRNVVRASDGEPDNATGAVHVGSLTTCDVYAARLAASINLRRISPDQLMADNGKSNRR